jgi:hypothetical protein
MSTHTIKCTCRQVYLIVSGWPKKAIEVLTVGYRMDLADGNDCEVLADAMILGSNQG